MTALIAANLCVRSEIKRVFVEGDYVILHSHARLSDEDRGTAVMDVFRVEDGGVVEHLDVLQAIPRSPSTRTACSSALVRLSRGAAFGAVRRRGAGR